MAEFAQYKVITAKLKKRFLLRKPNLSEATEQFTSLSRDLQDFKPYAGYCCLAAARCEQSLGNTSSELSSLLDAARHFRDGKELNAAISAYRHAIKICDQALLKSVFAELAQMYANEKRYLEAADAFRDGELFIEAADCFIMAKQYALALSSYEKQNEELLSHSELVTMYLLKLCTSDPRRCDVQFPVICCNSENDDIVSLNILLESLLLILKEGELDSSAKGQIYAQLYPRLNAMQRDLLHFVLDENVEQSS
jgi:tetratricopeptide (TPR) repeat protein